MEVLKGQEEGEIGRNYPTMLNISQLKRGMGGSQGGKDWSREVWTPCPYPLPSPPPKKNKAKNKNEQKKAAKLPVTLLLAEGWGLFLESPDN